MDRHVRFFAGVTICFAAVGCGPGQPREHSCAPANATPPSAAVPAADALVADLIHRYAALPRYHEESLLLSWTLVDSDPRLRMRAMQTDIRFERPDRMRVRFRVRDPVVSTWGVLVWNGDDIQSRTSYETGVHRWSRFDEAAGALKGVSADVTTTIPSLLHGRNPWVCRGEDPKPEFVGREVVGRTQCLKLMLIRRVCPPVTIWVDERTLLLRKIQTSVEISEAKSAEYGRELATVLPANAPARIREELEHGAASTTETVVVIDARADLRIDAADFVIAGEGEVR